MVTSVDVFIFINLYKPPQYRLLTVLDFNKQLFVGSLFSLAEISFLLPFCSETLTVLGVWHRDIPVLVRSKLHLDQTA